jgi:hypothetical protein
MGFCADCDKPHRRFCKFALLAPPFIFFPIRNFLLEKKSANQQLFSRFKGSIEMDMKIALNLNQQYLISSSSIFLKYGDIYSPTRCLPGNGLRKNASTMPIPNAMITIVADHRSKCDAGRDVARKRFMFRQLADRNRSGVDVNHVFVPFPPVQSIRAWSWTGPVAVTQLL